MAEYCPSCGTERAEQSDECAYCGAYVKEWRDTPVLKLEAPEEKSQMDTGERWVLHQLIRIAIPTGACLIAAIPALIMGIEFDW